MSKPAVPSPRRKQRGIALAYTGIMLLMFTAFAVIGVDVGRLAFTASEVQSMADSAALAAIGAHASGVIDPTDQTSSIVDDNTIDARNGTIDPGTTAGIQSLTPGLYDFATKTFTAKSWDDPSTNAAEAIGTATVSNLLAAIIGAADSSVERRAIAAMGPSCNQRVVMPVALEIDEVSAFLDSPTCDNLPPTQLFQIPDDNSCYTSLSQSSASADAGVDLLPEQCCKNNAVCGKGETVSVSKGDFINLLTGNVTNLLQVINGCLQDPDGTGPLTPLTEFIVPIVPSGKCNQGGEVLGFARIKIDHVEMKGGPDHPQGIYVTAICRDTLDGDDAGCPHGGGGNAISLVQ